MPSNKTSEKTLRTKKTTPSTSQDVTKDATEGPMTPLQKFLSGRKITPVKSTSSRSSESEDAVYEGTAPKPVGTSMASETFSSEEDESEEEIEPNARENAGKSALETKSLSKGASQAKKGAKRALLVESRRAKICKVTELCCMKCLNSGIQAFGESQDRDRLLEFSCHWHDLESFL